jgi:hypothetical protein
VANQKEKAIDQQSVLATLLADASVVAQRLQLCVYDTDQFYADLGQSGINPNFFILQTEANTADQVCRNAEVANQSLQAAIQANA